MKAKEPQIQDGSKEGKEEGGEEGEVRWEWEGDDGWTQYSATHSDDITAAFKSKKPCVILQVGVLCVFLSVGRPGSFWAGVRLGTTLTARLSVHIQIPVTSEYDF